MKRIGFIAALFIAVSSMAFSQGGCKSGVDTNRAASNYPAPNTNTEKETVDTPTLEKEKLQIENDWTRILKTHDVEAMKRAFADDVVLIYPDGSVGTKEQEIKDLEAGALTFESWDFADMNIKVLGRDAAVVTGHSVLKNGKYKGLDGKTIDISGHYRFTDVLARRNGRWQVVASQATKVTAPVPAAMSPAAKAPAAAPKKL